MNKILIISPYFYPFAGIGANRMTSLAKYLVNTTSFEIYVLKNSTKSYSNIIKNEEDLSLSKINYYEVDVENDFLKDMKIYKEKVIEILNSKKFDMVLISVGPFFTLPLVSLIKKIYGIKVTLDIRDFWAHEPENLACNVHIKKIKSLIKDWLFERKAIKDATYLVFMNDLDKEYLYRFYGKKLLLNKSLIISNGYDIDEDKLLGLSKPNFDKIKIVAFGKIAAYLNTEHIESLAEGINICNTRNNIEIIVEQIGYEEESLQYALKKNNIPYISKGYMEYSHGIKYIYENANIFLISSDLEEVGIGTKIYDYILCDRPVIYVGKKTTGLSKFIKNFDNGYVCSNKKEIKDAIDDIYNNRIDKLKSGISIKNYSRKFQNEKYLKFLMESIEKKYEK